MWEYPWHWFVICILNLGENVKWCLHLSRFRKNVRITWVFHITINRVDKTVFLHSFPPNNSCINLKFLLSNFRSDQWPHPLTEIVNFIHIIKFQQQNMSQSFTKVIELQGSVGIFFVHPIRALCVSGSSGRSSQKALAWVENCEEAGEEGHRGSGSSSQEASVLVGQGCIKAGNFGRMSHSYDIQL